MMFGIACGTSHLWWVVAAVLSLFLALIFIRYRFAHALVKRLGISMHPFLLSGYSLWRMRATYVFFITGVFFLLLCFLSPQWDKKEEIVVQQARDLLVVLDISRSMLAPDCTPNRLECAKQKIKQLMTMLSCERVGLMLFSGSAFVQCPLTMDYKAFYLFLDAVDQHTVSSGTTALDEAIFAAIRLFENGQERKNKIAVLFTDGEDFSSNLKQVKEKARVAGVHLFTIGMGTAQGAPIPVYDTYGKQQGFEKDARGAVVMSLLNEGILQSLSRDTGATYISCTSDDRDMRELVTYVARYEKERIEERKIAQLHERYTYAAFVSLVLLLIEWLL